jgi:hypothetical protein
MRAHERCVNQRRRPIGASRVDAQSDVEDGDLAGGATCDQEPALHAAEGERQICPHGQRVYLPAHRIHARRNIEGRDNGSPTPRAVSHDLARCVGHLAAQSAARSCPQQSVHDHSGQAVCAVVGCVRYHMLY